MIFSIKFIIKKFKKSNLRSFGVGSIVIGCILLIRITAIPGIEAIESVDPAKTGYLGGLGLPVLFSWIAGAFLACGLAFVVG